MLFFHFSQPDPLPFPVSNMDPGLDESEKEFKLANNVYVQACEGVDEGEGEGEGEGEDEGEGEGSSERTTRTRVGSLNRE